MTFRRIQWICNKCKKKWHYDINSENKLDKAKLHIMEDSVTIHVLKTQHEIIRKEKNYIPPQFGRKLNV